MMESHRMYDFMYHEAVRMWYPEICLCSNVPCIVRQLAASGTEWFVETVLKLNW